MSLLALNDAIKQHQPEREGADIPVLDKLIGWKQLEEMNQRSGVHNYATGRAMSPSTFKKYLKGSLNFYEQMGEPSQTKEERAAQWYDTRKKHFMLGDLLQDYLRLGREHALETKYYVAGEITANVRKICDLKGKKGITVDDDLAVKAMYERIVERAPDYLENLRNCQHEEDRTGVVDVNGTEMTLRGIADAVRVSDYGNDIKSIEKASMIRQRVFDKPWGQFNYWLQPAIYGKLWNLETFDFLFITKQKHTLAVIMTFEREALEQMWEYLHDNWLTAFIWSLENGFEMEAPKAFRRYLPEFQYKMKMV